MAKAKIAEPIQGLAVELDRLSELPGNPRRGDVEAVALSYRTFGQRKPVVARVTGVDDQDRPCGVITDGNHQLKAARMLGWPHLAVVFIEEGQTEAEAYALAANRTGELGDGYDLEALSAMTDRVATANQELFEATAWTEDDLVALNEPDDAPGATDGRSQMGSMTYALMVTCSDERQQSELMQRWHTEGLSVKAMIL